MPRMSPPVSLFRAFAAADGLGWSASPAALLVRSAVGGGGLPEVLAAGKPEDVERHEAAASAGRIDLPGSVILPALVNAHTHLDLTHIGPRPFDKAGGFASWARMIISNRLADGAALEQSVRDGVRRSIAGGVAAVGDISGVMRAEPVRVLRESGLMGVSFIEFFGLGERQGAAAEAAWALLTREGTGAAAARVRVGLQPHAPYTAGPRLMEWTARQHADHGVPICTHLAETAAEREFIARASGPFRELLESLGLWSEAILRDYGHGRHPIAHMQGVLEAAVTPRDASGSGGWLVAHVNDCDDAGLEVLARTGTSVAYCPRSSDYFRNQEAFGPHRYREMPALGINVCLGTDSVVNLPPEESDRLSTLDEMRFLFRRDGTDPVMLLRMATINGATALGIDPLLFRIGGSGGAIAGLVAVDVQTGSGGECPLEAALRSSRAPRFIVPPFPVA